MEKKFMCSFLIYVCMKNLIIFFCDLEILYYEFLIKKIIFNLIYLYNEVCII